jgi:hypothetical protein
MLTSEPLGPLRLKQAQALGFHDRSASLGEHLFRVRFVRPNQVVSGLIAGISYTIFTPPWEPLGADLNQLDRSGDIFRPLAGPGKIRFQTAW